jgi:putative membrane protein
MHHRLPLFALAALLATGTPALAQDKPVKEANKLNKKRIKAGDVNPLFTKAQLKYDSEFATAATSDNLLASALSALAVQKGTALEVKDFAKQTDADHTELQNQLQAVADRSGLVLPKMMSHDDRKIYDDVDDRKYLGFDKKYLRDLGELHERAIKRYAEAADQASTPELRAYAAETLPKLREHAAHTAELFKRANERK